METGAEKQLGRQKEVFDDLGKSLDSLKIKLEKGEEAKTEKYQKALHDCLIDLSGSISDSAEKEKFNNILEKLKNPDIQIQAIDIEELRKIISVIEDKKLNQVDLEKLKNKIHNIGLIKLQIAKVFESVNPLDKYKKKVEEAKVNFITKIKESPFMGRLAMYLLPDTMREELKPYVDSVAGKPGWFEKFLCEDMGGFGKWMASIILSWFGGKAILKSVEVLKSVWNSIPQSLRNIKDFFGDEGTKKFADAVKTAAEGLDQEFLEKIKQFKIKLKEQLRDYIRKRMGIKNKTDKEIDSVVDEFIDEEDKKGTFPWEKIMKKYKEGGEFEYSVLDGFLSILKGSTLMLRFMLKLIKKGIISPGDFLIQTGKHYLSYGFVTLGLIKDSVGKFSGEFSSEQILQTIENLQLSDGERQFVGFMLYRKGGIVCNILGKIAGIAVKGALYLPAYAGQDLSKIGARWSSFSGDYAKQLEIVKNIQSRIGEGVVNEKITSLRSSLGEMEDFYKFWGWYVESEKKFKNFGGTLEDFVRKENFDISLVKKFVGKNLNLKDVTHIRANVTQRIGNLGTSLKNQAGDWFSSVGKYWKGGLSEQAIYQGFGEEMVRTSNSLSEIIRNDDSIRYYRNLKNQFYDKIKLGEGLSKQIGLSDDFVLRFNNVEDFRSWMDETKVLMRKCPEGARLLFGKFPIIAIAGMELTKDDHSFKDFMKSMSFLIPLVGPCIVLSETKLKGKDGKITFDGDFNTALFSLGIAGYDIVRLFKGFEFSKVGLKRTVKFLAQPVIDVVDLASMVSKGAHYTAKYTADSIKVLTSGGGEVVSSGLTASAKDSELFADGLKGMRFGEINMSRGAIIGLLLLAGVAYTTDGFGYFSQNKELIKEFKEAQEKGDIDKYQKELLTQWSKLDDRQKEDQLRSIIRLRFYLQGYPNVDNIRFDENKIVINYKKYIPTIVMVTLKEDILKRLHAFNLMGKYTDLVMSFDEEQALKTILVESFNVPLEDIKHNDLREIQSKIHNGGLRVKDKTGNFVKFDKEMLTQLKEIFANYGYSDSEVSGILGYP